MWTPAPERMVTIRGNGLGNMADLADEQSPARFQLETFRVNGVVHPVELWCLVGLRARWTGGSGQADLSLYVDHRCGSLYDWRLRHWAGMGTGGNPDLVFRVVDERDLYAMYAFFPGDAVCLVWTNPAAGTMRWVVEVSLCAAVLGRPNE